MDGVESFVKILSCTLKRCFKIFVVVSIIIVIPVLFNFLFHGDSESKFWFIKSSLSASDWFAFWISYISTIVSTILACAALKLSKTIELSHQYEEATRNKDMFVIENVNMGVKRGKDIDKAFDIKVTLPFKVQSLNDLYIKKAYIKFNDGVEMNLKFDDAFVCGNEFELHTSQEENIKQNNERILIWKYWRHNMTRDFETIFMNITYCYSFTSFNYVKKRKMSMCTIDVRCQIVSDPNTVGKTTTINSVATITNIKKECVRTN